MKINGPGESSLLLLKVIKVLEKLKIPYAVVGAFAVSFYGWVRASLDADCVISVEGKEKLEQLASSLRKDALKVELRRGDSSDPIRCMVNIEDKFRNRVDLLTGIRGMREDVYQRQVKACFMNESIKIISVEDLVAMKIYAGSAQDLQDAAGVLQISAGRIDLALLKRLTRQYGKKELELLEDILLKMGGEGEV